MSETKVCPACSHLNPVEAVFCSQCGANQGATKTVPPVQFDDPYMAPTAPTAPMPPTAYMTPLPAKSGSWKPVVGIGLVVLLAMCSLGGYGFYRSTRSGIIIDGQELSKAEATKGMREIKEMAAGARPGGKVTKSNVVPTTALSRKYKDLSDEIANSEAKFEAFMNASPLEKAMDAPMTTQTQRDTARKAAADYDRAIAEYFDEEISSMTRFRDFLTQALPSHKVQEMSQIGRLTDLKRSYATISKTRLAFLDFLDAHPPVSQGGENFLFKTQKELDEFRAIAKGMIDAGEAYDKLYASGEKRVQGDFDKAMDALQGF